MGFRRLTCFQLSFLLIVFLSAAFGSKQRGGIRASPMDHCLCQQKNWGHQVKLWGARFRAERCDPHLSVQFLTIGHVEAMSFHEFKKQAGNFKNISEAHECKINAAGSESPCPAYPQQWQGILGSSITQLFWLRVFSRHPLLATVSAKVQAGPEHEPVCSLQSSTTKPSFHWTKTRRILF